MAGFDLDKQKSFTIPGGGRGEAGYFDISAYSRSQEVPTRLNTCYFGVGIAQLDTAYIQHNLIATTDCSISTAAMTFYRHGQHIQEDTRYYYIVFGW